MKYMITIISVALLVSSIGLTAEAATKKDSMAKGQKAQCQKEAKAKYSAVHVLKRHAFVKECMQKKV